MAPIVPVAADLCCAEEVVACSTELNESSAPQLSSTDGCAESHGASTGCETCALCHASFVSNALRSAAPHFDSSRTAILSFVPEADPVRLVLTPPPSLA